MMHTYGSFLQKTILLMTLSLIFIHPVMAEISAEIVEMGIASGPFRTGDTVEVIVKVKNSGSTTWNFMVGYSVQDPNGNWWDAPAKNIILSSGEVSAPFVLGWLVPPQSPVGTYNAKVAVWENQVSSLMYNRLTEKDLNGAFWILGSLFIIQLIPSLITVFPQLFYSLVKERKSVRKLTIVLYGFSSIAFGASLSLLQFPTALFQILAAVFVGWGIACLTFALLYKRKYSTVFSYRNPGSLAIGILIYTYLMPRIEILIIVTAALLISLNWFSRKDNFFKN